MTQMDYMVQYSDICLRVNISLQRQNTTMGGKQKCIYKIINNTTNNNIYFFYSTMPTASLLMVLYSIIIIKKVLKLKLR